MMQITLLTSFRRWLQRMRVRRATIRELSALSDQQLDDIGIPRAYIPEVAEQMLAARERATVAGNAESSRGRNADPAKPAIGFDSAASCR